MTTRSTEPAAASLAKSIALPHPPVYGGNGPIGGPPGTVVTIVGEYFINVEQVLFRAPGSPQTRARSLQFATCDFPDYLQA